MARLPLPLLLLLLHLPMARAMQRPPLPLRPLSMPLMAMLLPLARMIPTLFPRDKRQRAQNLRTQMTIGEQLSAKVLRPWRTR
jgi:hypothetical protein